MNDSPLKLRQMSAGQRTISAGNMNNCFRGVELALSTQYDQTQFRVIKSPAGIFVSLVKEADATADDESKWAFGMISSASSCTVYSGSILFDKAWREFTTDTILLNGTPCYVYVSCNRVSYACTLKQANTKPTDTGSEINLLIAEFTGTGSSYTLTRRHWRNSYNADANLPT